MIISVLEESEVLKIGNHCEVMMDVLKILSALRNTNSTNEKIFILKQNKDNNDLKEILKYTYDHVTYTYGISSWNMLEYECDSGTDNKPIDVLEMLSEREVTGHSALKLAKQLYNTLTDDYKELFCQILDRDLKIGVGEKTLNKIWKGLIPKPNYCRCGVYSEKNKIKYPAFVQLKCDGTYREAYVHNGTVTFKTRSGETDENPILSEKMKGLPNGYYLGELTIGRADCPDMNRAEGNGLINSDNPPYDKIHFTIWDFLEEDDYSGKRFIEYSTRLSCLEYNLSALNDEYINSVPSVVVNSPKEALHQVSEWMSKGLEGGVLKDFNMKFKNGTSNQQLKIKLIVDADLRCVELIDGNDGTKYEGMKKVIAFESDDGKIKGQCSGMTDDMISEVTENPDKYINKIVTIEFNDLSKAQGNDYYALTHPRFVEWRDDKTETDSYERVIELRDMAKNL